MKNLPIIYLEQKVHRKIQQLLVRFEYNDAFIKILRNINGAKWSKTLKSWYVQDSKENLNLIISSFENIAILDTTKISKKEVFKRKLSDNERKLLNDFYLYLRGKRYSKSTIQTYTFFVADFINFHTEKLLTELNNRDVELFIEKVFIERKYSVSTQRQFISAVKVFYCFLSPNKN